MCASARGDSRDAPPVKAAKFNAQNAGLMDGSLLLHNLEATIGECETINSANGGDSLCVRIFHTNWLNLPIFDTCATNKNNFSRLDFNKLRRYYSYDISLALGAVRWWMWAVKHSRGRMAFDRFENYQLFRTTQPRVSRAIADDLFGNRRPWHHRHASLSLLSTLSWRHFAINKHHISTLHLEIPRSLALHLCSRLLNKWKRSWKLNGD